MHLDIVRQAFPPKLGLKVERSFGLQRRAENPRPPSVVTTGEICLAVKSHPARCAADMYAVIARHAHVSEQPLSANNMTASLAVSAPLMIDTLYEYGMSVQTPTNCCYKVHAFTTAVSNENGHVVLLLNVLEGYGTTAVLQDCP